MKRAIERILPLVVTVALIVPAAAAWAHDDGLTCHSHPVRPTEDLLIWNNGDGSDFMGIDPLAHAFENLATRALEGRQSRFDAEQVAAARKGLAELGEMVEMVRRLVVRAEQTDDAEESTNLVRAARQVLATLPIGDFLPFQVFAAENRRRAAVLVPLEVVVAYLTARTGMPDALAAILGRAFEAC